MAQLGCVPSLSSGRCLSARPGACITDASPLQGHPFRAASCSSRPGSSGLSSVRRLMSSACRAVSEKTKTPELTIENLSSQYCNDFVCESSPAVEQTVRSLARDIERQRLTISLYQKDAKWSDGFRSSKGVENIPRTTWVSACLSEAKPVVKRLQMLDKGTAQIDWVLTGKLSVVPVDIAFITTVTMNLVTGRVEDQKLQWDLSKCAAPAAAVVTLQRTLWSTQQNIKSTTGALGGKAKNALDSFDGFESGGPIYQNPDDPTRFFQQRGGDQKQNDYIAFGFLLALLYFASKLYGELIALG